MPIVVSPNKLPFLLEWLTAVLDPLTLADSATLADYVVALLRHDKSHDSLKSHVIEQLSDFLKDHTNNFVDELFRVLDG